MNTKIKNIKIGETFKLAGIEFIKLDEDERGVHVLAKECIGDSEFGKNSNFAGSKIKTDLENKFLEKLAGEIGEENVVPHTVDLTALNGDKMYDEVECKVSLLTLDAYRKYKQVLDGHHVDGWWWLATPDSKAYDRIVLCVSPSGNISNRNFFSILSYGVRPFCILKSSIFGS